MALNGQNYSDFWSEVHGCSNEQGTRDNIIGDHPVKTFAGSVNSSWRSHGDPPTGHIYTCCIVSVNSHHHGYHNPVSKARRDLHIHLAKRGSWMSTADFYGPLNFRLSYPSLSLILSLVFAEVGEESTDN